MTAQDAVLIRGAPTARREISVFLSPVMGRFGDGPLVFTLVPTRADGTARDPSTWKPVTIDARDLR